MRLPPGTQRVEGGSAGIRGWGRGRGCTCAGVAWGVRGWAHILTRMPSRKEVVRSHSSSDQSGITQSGSDSSDAEISGSVQSGGAGHSSSGKARRRRLSRKRRSGTEGHGDRCG